MKSKHIREVSTTSIETYIFFFLFGSFFPIHGLQSGYNCFLFICTIISEHSYRPEIFYTYILWFSLNSKKTQHYFVSEWNSERQSQSHLETAAKKPLHGQENTLLSVKEEPQAIQSKCIKLRLYLFSIQNYAKWKHKQINGKIRESINYHGETLLPFGV